MYRITTPIAKIAEIAEIGNESAISSLLNF
jgi:hypothetical protein